MAKVKKKIKTITVDADRCNGCRGCEIVCSMFHASPKNSANNPAKSRVQVLTNRIDNKWLPVFAGEYAPAECAGREKYIIDGKTYDECEFCRAACPSRDLFKDPDSGLPLKCDMCEDLDDPQAVPKCVEWCLTGVLKYEEREVEVEDDQPKLSEMDLGLDSLISRFGKQKVAEAFARMTKKG
ncbi:MAG: (4Fe-4S)-binding protein [Deltaproteobacteria bacterium]|nr:(4Fe-4S)-binding protein [Deltaproteobacteria bacterium]